jgi:hypothetical protein
VLLEDYRPDSIPGDPTAKIHHLERNFHAFRLFECVQCVGDSPESTRLERSQQSLTFRPMGERNRTGNSDFDKELRNHPILHRCIVVDRRALGFKQWTAVRRLRGAMLGNTQKRS